MLYLICTTITSVDLAHYGVSRAKDRVSVDCGTINTLKGNEYTFRCSDPTIFPFFASLLKRVASSRKEIAPLGANSFLED